MTATTMAIQNAMPKGRILKLVKELEYASKHTDRKTMMNWGVKSGKLFLISLGRRGKGFLNAVRSLGTGFLKGAINLGFATKEGKLKAHMSNLAADLTIGVGVVRDKLVSNIRLIVQRLREKPAAAGSELLVAVLGFYLGSGGLDGDGGIPDLDLEMGIGAHRSIWFHSIIPGATAEAAVFSLAMLVNTVHSRLPAQHDPIWDRIATEYNRLSVAFASGTCAGLAYHLMVDATWDAGKAYSDLPFSMPMEGHQTLMGANALAESIDVDKKHPNGETLQGN